jgi:NAD(P)-dependent dehydrogenase (short-subunit alcohol dehydrogenase family)
MPRSYVVTGGGRGIGRAMVERLLGDADNAVAIELDPAALAWTDHHPAGRRVIAVAGDAAEEAVAEQAAELAQAAGTLAGSTTPPCSTTPGSTPRPPVRCWTSSRPTSTLPWSAARP